MNSYGLGGKVAVVTGGASGIGRACAHVLARSGADISVWDLDQDAIDVVLQELEAFECRAHGAVVDVSDSSAVDAAMDDVIDKLGHVSVVVANAGIGGEQASCSDYTDEGRHRVISVNLDGVFLVPAGRDPCDEGRWTGRVGHQHGLDPRSRRLRELQRLCRC